MPPISFLNFWEKEETMSLWQVITLLTQVFQELIPRIASLMRRGIVLDVMHRIVAMPRMTESSITHLIRWA